MEGSVSELHCGVLKTSMLLKVDRIIHNEVVRVFGNFPRPLKDLLSVDVVFFDTKFCRIVARLDSKEVMDRFAWRSGKGGCYKIGGCGGETWRARGHEKYHFQFLPGTTVAEDFAVKLP